MLYLIVQVGAKRVIGVELCQQAIEDAKKNALLNGIVHLMSMTLFHIHIVEFAYALAYYWGSKYNLMYTLMAGVDRPRRNLNAFKQGVWKI